MRLYEAALLELPPEGPEKRRAAQEDIQRPGPAKFNRTKDPVKTLHALAFTNVLRNTADFSDALQKARTYDDAGSDEVERDSGKDASQRTICRSYGRMDIVGCILAEGGGTRSLKQTTWMPSS